MVFRNLITLSLFVSLVFSHAGTCAQEIQLDLAASLYDGECRDICLLNDTAYVACASGLEIIEFTDPALPRRVGQVLRPDGAQLVALVNNGIALAANDSLLFYDITNVKNPMPQAAWLMNGRIDALQYHHDYLYFVDQTGWGRIDCGPAPVFDYYLESSVPVSAIGFASDSLIVALSDGMTLIFHIRGTPQAVGVYHWRSDILSISVDWPLVFGAAGDPGVFIVDLDREPADMEIGRFYTYGVARETYPFADGLYVADSLRGLMILGLNDPERPYLLGVNAEPQDLRAIDVWNSTLAGAAADGVYTIDIANPFFPRTTGHYGDYYQVGDLAWSGEILLAAVDGAGLCLIDIADTEEPVVLSEISFVEKIHGLDAQGNLAALACGDDGIILCDLSDPAIPVEVFREETVGFAVDVALDDSLAIVADYREGFRIFNVTDPANANLIGGKSTSRLVTAVARRKNIVFAVAPDIGIYAFDISFAFKPKEVWRFATAGRARDILLDGNRAFLAVDSAGVYVFDISNPSLPVLVDHWDMFYRAQSVVGAGALYYVLDDSAGVVMVDYRETGNPQLISTTSLAVPAVSAAYAEGILCLSGDPYLFILREDPPALAGDMNEDGVVSLVDAVLLVNYLFRAGMPPLRVATVDLNRDGRLNLVDLIWLIRILFGN